jgi:hypothetical protein
MNEVQWVLRLIVAAGIGVISMDAVLAAPPNETVRATEARRQLARGQELAQAGRCDEALAAFATARALYPSPAAALQAAQCERVLGHYARAHHLLTVSLWEHEGGVAGGLPPTQLTTAKQALAELSALVVRLEVTVDPKVEEAFLAVDGRPLVALDRREGSLALWAGIEPSGPPTRVSQSSFILFVDPGSHQVSLQARGYQALSLSQNFSAGQAAPLPLRLQKIDRDALLHVNSSIPGASVTVNGRPVGQAPAEVRLPPGVAQITVGADGYEAHTQSVTIGPGDEITVTGVPQRIEGTKVHLRLPRDDKRVRLAQVVGQSTRIVTGVTGGKYPQYYRRSVLVDDWSDVCGAPCDRYVPTGARLRLQGEGFTPSKTFRLPDGQREVTVDVKRIGSSGRRGAGVGLLSGGVGLGLGLALGGGILLVLDSTDNLGRGFLAGGVALVGVGLIVGIPLLATSGTSVRIIDGKPSVALPGRGDRQLALTPTGLVF